MNGTWGKETHAPGQSACVLCLIALAACSGATTAKRAAAGAAGGGARGSETHAPLGRVSPLSGVVQIKRVGEPNWTDTSEGGDSLSHSDLVFTGETGEARIDYASGASMRIGPLSIVSMEANPPALSHFRRRFAKDKASVEATTKKPASGLSFLAPFKGGGTRVGQGEDSLAAIERSVAPLDLPFKERIIIIRDRALPATLPLALPGSTPDGTGLWCYVWTGRDASPVTSLYSRQRAFDVKLRAYGSYTVQVVAEDDSAASPAIVVHVVPRREGVLDTAARELEFGHTAPKAVFIQ